MQGGKGLCGPALVGVDGACQAPIGLCVWSSRSRRRRRRNGAGKGVGEQGQRSKGAGAAWVRIEALSAGV